jgi:histidine triad (HIT) family protein
MNIEKENCIFCSLVKKEIPCDLVYENENFFSFLDIKPVSKGHLLIIPKKHIVWMSEADDETISEIFKLTKKLMQALQKALQCDFVQMSVVGEEVPHFHIHLIPRYFSDNLPNLPTQKYEKEIASELIQKINLEL